MKSKLYDISGKEKASVELPKAFDSSIRADIVQKYFEVHKLQNLFRHSPLDTAGRRHSASGTISHRRHEWKGHYGKGISRVPRKAMWRRGTQFYWVATETSQTRGGRTINAPSGIRTPLKMNKKEVKIAMNSAFAATASKEYVSKRYSSVQNLASPVVIESLPSKTKELIASLKSIFGNAFSIILRNKVQRAGKGKARGRRYKSNAGLLVVKGKSEPGNFKGVDVKSLGEISISDLYPLGRLTLYTKKALEEMEASK